MAQSNFFPRPPEKKIFPDILGAYRDFSYLCKRNTWIMTKKNRYVLDQIRQVARNSAPEGSVVLLFGSRARGQARRGSDWDILIVLPKSQLQQADYDQVSYPLVELGWTLGEQINPIVYTKQEWEASSITPFYDNVQRDGISLL